MNIKLRPTTLAARIALLPPGDRTLLHLRNVAGLTCDEVAAVIGLSAGQVSRRARLLAGRLSSPEARLLGALFEAPPPEVSPIAVRIAFHRYVAGLSVRQLARAWHLTRAGVLKHLRRIKAFLAV